MKTLGKKLISMVLLLSMLLSAVPMEVLAATVNAQPHVHAALYEKPGEEPDVFCENCHANIKKGEIHKPHCASLADGYCTCQEDNNSNLHDKGCPLYVPVCTCNAEEDAEHRPGCEILERNSGCICTLDEDQTHKSACPLYVPHCDCQAAAGEEHRPGCDILKHTENCICSLGEIEHRIGCPLLAGCTCKPGLSDHAHGCSLHECKCDCGKTEDETTHKPGCHLLKYTEDGSACTCALGAERHGTDCPLYQDEGCTCGVFGYGTPHTNACDLRYALCNCGTLHENVNDHKDGCPLYIPQCDCGTTTDEHTSDCATQQPICSCGAGRIGENNKVNHYHATTCPLYEECDCTSGSNDTKYHDPSCPLYLACTCKSMSNATKYHEDTCPLYLECDCDSDSNETKYHQPSCPLYVECECSQHSNDTKYHIPTCPLYVKCTCGAGIDSRDHTETCPLYVDCTCGAVAGIPHDPTCPRYMKPCSCGAPKGGPHQNGCTRYSNEIVQPTEKTLQALINEASSNGGMVTWHTPGSNIYEDINIPVTKKGLVVDLQGATLHPAAISGRAAGTGLVVNNINVYGDATFKNGTIDGTGLTNARGVLVYSGAHFGAGDDLTISNFTVESSGGGIRVDKNAGLYLSSTANICNNTARDLGGGVYIYDGAQLTLDAAFGAETVNEKPVGIHHNTATYGGGLAMYVINEYINEAEEGEEKLGVMRNLSLRYNKAISGGGGLYVTSYAYVNFVNMVLEKNTSDTNGGAAMFASNVDLKFTDLTMTDNVAATAGGGMYITGWSDAKANADNKVEIINPNIYNNTAGYGGAIYGHNRMEVDIHADESTTDATKKRLSSNTALTSAGGAMRFNSYATVSLTNLDIKDNVSEVSYGGVLYTTTAMKLELRDVDVQNNVGHSYGGAFYLGTNNAAHTVNVYSGNYENNRVSASLGSNEGRGGVFYLAGGTLNVYGGRFYNNYAQYYGGAIYKSNYGTNNIYSGIFDSNRVATYDGGAIYTGGTTNIKLLPLEEGDNPQVFAPAVVFTKNNARYGGSIGQDGGSITVAPDVILATGERLISAHFTECTSWNAGCGIYTGSPAYIHGGLYEKATAGGPVVWGYNGTVTADGGEFTNNATYSIGTHDGTVNIDANASDTEHNGVWVHDNRNTGLGSTASGAFNIHGGVIENNSGNGVYCNRPGSIRMDGGIVRNNTGTGLAIGNYVWDRYISSVTVSGGLITGNGTRGILAGTVAVSGGTISNNGSAAQSGNGGGIYGNKITITGGTITGNTAAYGGGIYCGPGNIDRRNNSASVGGKYLYVNSRSIVSITGGTIQDNTAGYLGNDIFVMEPEYKIITETISPSADAEPAEYSISFALEASKNMTDPETRVAYSESPEKVTAWYDEIDKLNLQDKIDPRRHLDTANKMWDAYTFVYAGEEKYVAQIGGVKYTTLQAAFDAIKAGEAFDEYGEPCSDIFMIDNTLENVVVPDGITATLDLRGKQVRCGVGTVLTVNGAITLEIMDTVRDSKGNVKGEISGATTSGIAVGGGASVTISSGNVCNNTNSDATGLGGGIRVDDGGTVRITGTARIHDNGMPMDGRGGGGIGVMSGGVLNMDGGTIDKNTVTKNTTLPGATAGTGIGAGVYVLEGGTFNMSGGTISDNVTPYNRGSGVAVRGAFNMTGGKITNNSAGQADSTTKGQSWGGAVYVVGTGVFTMSANAENPQVVPEITNNKGNWGAGVLVMSGGQFTMNDGLIKGNVCPEGNSYNSGGGVFLYDSNTKFTMNGGVIEENIANEGGGMTMYTNFPTFEMNGGIIRNNTARTSWGGAICVSSSHHCGPLTMNGGVITGNTAKTSGGGISLGRKATFNMTGEGTKIYANTAGSDVGNDIYIYNYDSSNNDVTIQSIINIGSQDVTVPGTTQKYDCWHSDGTGHDFKVDSDLATIAAKTNMVAANGGYQPRNGSVGLTAAVAKPTLEPDDNYVAYYIPAGLSAPTANSMFTTLQAAVDAVSSGEATEEKPIPSGGTIYLMADFAENVDIPAAVFTLNMNGHTVNGAMELRSILNLRAGADVTITDTASTKLTVTIPASVDTEGNVIDQTTEERTVDNYAHKQGGTGTLTKLDRFAEGTGIDMSAGSSLTVEKCVLEGFTAVGKSGVAIKNASGTLVLNEGTVIRNNTYTGTGEGGAVHVSGSGTATVNGGTYTGNKNTRGTGAAFRLTGVDKAATKATLTINGGTFSGNEAVNGGVIAAVTNCEVNIYGGKFTDNKCTGTDKSDNDNKTGLGGVLYTYGSTNSANKVVIDGGEFDASKHVGEDRPEPNLLFADNYAAHGGAIFATLSTMTINGTDVPTKTKDEDPNNTLVFKNNTSYRGGAIFIGTGSNWRKGWINTINGGLFMDNEASYQGGAIFLQSHTLRVTGGEFFRNTAAPAGSSDAAGGGAIYRRDWDDNHIELTISGGEFHENTAKYGGAIRNERGSVTVTGDAEIYENKANISGGAIYTPGNYSVIVSGMANIHDNQSVSAGGAIRGFVTMRDDSGNGTDCPKINNNTTTGSSGGAVYGGLNMSVGEMCGNSGYSGGAVYLTDTSATVSGGVMNNNTARAGNGGAIWGDVWDHVYIKGGELSGNVAKKTSDGKEGHGGAIYNYYGDTSLTGGSIHDNKAEGDGGAVWVYSNDAHTDSRYYANLPITGTKLVNNTAGGNGGAVYYGSKYSQGYLRLYGGGLITGNRAGNLGGGIYMAIAGQQYSTGPSRTEFNIGLFDSASYPGTGSIYGNSAALGQDIYTVAESKDDIIKATDMDLPEDVIANCWLDESNQRGIFNEIHGITNRYYALTLDYKVEKVVALLPLKTPAADGSTVKEFTSVQDAISFAQQNPDLIESAFLNNNDVDDNLPTLILVDDVKENITIPNDVKLTLNLNHHTFSGQGTAITVNGTMNIRDEVMDDEQYEGRFTKIDNTDPTKPVKVYGSGNDETKGTIEGGSNTTAGALKVAYGGKVTAYDGRIANSRSVDGGAGVYIANGTFTLDGATIENNVNSTGPAVYINTNAANFIMKSGLITGNKDSNGNGQGIIHNNGGSMSMTGGVIAGNTGNSVIYNEAGAKLSITGGSITNNTTRYGAIYVKGGSVEIDGGLNQNVLIAGNTGSVNGGAMYVNTDGTVFMSNALITGNSAPRGGGIYQNGGTITINEGLEITENSASVRGGGIFQNGGKLTMINGSVIANEAPIGGGIAQEAISSAEAVVADGVKIFGNKSLQSAAGNDIYSAYEGTANWESIKDKKSSIALEAVKDMRQTDLYNVWRDDVYTGEAYGTAERLGEGMYITGSIEKSENLQLTTYYFDQAASEEPLSDNYRIDAVYFTNDGFQSGTYPISDDGKKTVTDTPANLRWEESTNPDDWYEDPTTGEIIKKRINPSTGAAVEPTAQVPIIAEKKASEMGWHQSDETYTINIGAVPTTLHYLEGPDGLYEQNQMVEWRPGDDCDRRNTLVMTNDTVAYGFSLTLNQKDENKEQDINKARIWVEVELDADMSQAELKLATMTGGDTDFKGYVTTREGEDGMVQVMRGYIDVTIVEGIYISGSFLMNIKDMHDKDTLKPKIRSWIEGDMENVLDAEGKPVTDSEGKPVQQLHVAEGNAERLTVSATGKYNLSLLQNTGMAFTGYFDMANGVKVSKSEYEAVGDDDKPLNPNVKYGTMLGYGLTVMLYNDTSDEGKGIRGIELPADGLEFDVSLKGNLFLEGEPIVGSDGKQLSTTPIFWAGKENEPGTMGRPLNSTSASMNMNWNDEDDAVQNTPYAWNAAPYNSGNDANSVYNGGGWQFMQATGVTKAPGEEIIHVKVNGYTFNIADADDINPVNNSNGSASTIFSSKFVKAFSAGYIQILYPYPAEEVEDLEGYLTIENQTAAHSLEITTASGNTPVEDPGIGNLIQYFGASEAEKHAKNEMHYVDNYCSGSNGMFIQKQVVSNGDILSVRNYYRTEDGGEIDGMEGGNGIAPLGTKVSIGATGSFTSKAISTVDEFLDKAGKNPNPYYIPDDVKNIQLYDNDEFNYLTAMNMLQKIDADAFTPVGGAKIVNQRVSMGQLPVNGAVRVTGNESLPSWGTSNDKNHPNPTTTMNLTVLYAAKPDGSNWDKVNVTANDMLKDSYYAGKYRPVYGKEEPDKVVGVEYEGMTYYGDEVVLTDGGIADMNKYHEEQLIYFETMDDLKAYFKAKDVSDPKCVGVLYQARDCCIRTGHELGFEVIAQITEDFAKTGKTYATTSDSRIWTTYRPEYRSYRASTSAERTSKLLYDFNWDTIPYVDGSVAKGLGLQNADGTPDQRTFVDSLNQNDPVVAQKMPDMEDDPDRTNERFYYFYKTGTLSNRYTLATIKDADGNEIGKEWVVIPQENTRHTLGISTYNFCSTNTDANVGKKVPYIKTEYAYGYHKGGTHNSWARGNSLLVHTLNSSIAIVVSDRISEQSNAQKQEYNLSNGDHLANFMVDPRLEKQSQVNNSLLTDAAQSTKVEIILDFPVGLLYSDQSIDFDYTPDKEAGKDAETYAQGELTWDISEVQKVKDEDGNVIGTRVIATTYVPDVTKRLPKITFAAEIDGDKISGTTTLNMKSSINATYEEYNSMAAVVQVDTVPIIVKRDQFTGIYHDLLTLPLDAGPNDNVYSSLVEIGEDFGYELTFYNDMAFDKNNPAKNVRLADVLPYNNDGRNDAGSFAGGYTVKKIQVTFEGVGAGESADEFAKNGKVIYGGKHDSPEAMMAQNDEKGLTKDEKLSKAYNELLGTSTEPGLFDTIVNAGLSELLNQKKVNRGNVGTADKPKYVFEYDVSAMDLQNLTAAVRNEYLSRLPEGTTPPSDEALDAAITAAIKDILGLRDEDLATPGINVMASDNKGPLIYVDMGNVFGKTTAHVNIVLNGARDVTVTDEEGNESTEHQLITTGVTEANPQGSHQTGGNSYTNSFGSNTNEALLKSQKDAVTVVERKLTGFVFLDMNHDGRFVAGDTVSDKKLDGIEVWLYKVEGGKKTLAKDVLDNDYYKTDKDTGKLIPICTKDGGSYTFNNVGPGDYIVEFTDPSGERIDGKLPWGQMSVTTRVGDDGDVNTVDPFWTNTNMNRCVPVYTIPGSGTTDTGDTGTTGTGDTSASKMTSLTNAADAEGITVLAMDDPDGEQPDSGVPASGACKLEKAQLYANVPMPGKNGMKTATVISSNNNLGIYCIEARVEKQWTDMIEDVEENEELNFKITGSNGYEGNIKLTQGESWNQVTIEPDENIYASEARMTVSVVPAPKPSNAYKVTDNTRLPSYTWTSGTFYLRAENCNGVIKYKHVEELDPALVGYKAPEYKTKLEKSTGITTFWVSNTQRNHPLNIQKVDLNNLNKGLEGAKFAIVDEKGERLDFVPTVKDGKGVYFRAADNVTYSNGTTKEMEVDANGMLKIEGLPEGNLYLIETKAPKGGYTKAAGKYKLVFGKTGVNTEEDVNREGYDEDKLKLLAFTDAETGTDSAGGETITYFCYFKMPNPKTFRLPTTGGEGITTMLVTGLAAAAAGMVLLLEYRKRKRNNKTVA